MSKAKHYSRFLLVPHGPSGGVACMILELAVLDVRAGQERAFERDFITASRYISGISGYISHELNRCLEKPNRYILLAHWETLEAHTVGFRTSADYLEWKRLLHPYYDPFPVVEHYSRIFGQNV